MHNCVNHPDIKAGRTCPVCKKPYCDECVHQSIGVCKSCILKIVTILFVLMTIGAYTAWYALL